MVYPTCTFCFVLIVFSVCSRYLHSYYGLVYSLLTGLKPLKPSSSTYFNNQQLCILPTECIYGFIMIPRRNSDYLLKQQKPPVDPLRQGLNA
jgi:hypothetical protein